MKTIRNCLLPVALAMLAAIAGCSSPTKPVATTVGSGDVAFSTLADSILQTYFRRYPSSATALGMHRYDDQLDDFSAAAFGQDAATAATFKAELQRVDTTTLSLDHQLDRQQLMYQMDGAILGDTLTRMWARNADLYSSGITNAAYVIMARNFAPAAQRLASLVAREKRMPAALLEAKRNLVNPPKVFTQIAIQQVDGDVHFFQSDLPAAFADVTDSALLASFHESNSAVIAALTDYKTFLEHDLLPKSTGNFALGATTYARALADYEMIDVPLDRLLQIAEADRVKNESAFVATAKQIDSIRSAAAVLQALQANHPAATDLLKVTQAMLDSLRSFIVEHHIVTIPPSDPAHVKETPPFLRATTTASMETPGPFEATRVDAFYNMTLPDPRTSAAEQEAYMKGWYYAAISNVSVHEVYPGHYIQFLYAKDFPTDVRKVFGASSNAEGWAHYTEQMMLDEGFHAGDPKYRLAQLQDALLRDVRFIVGIKLHTQGMTVEQATTMFETAGHQPHPIAVAEALRGTGDPLYGYYTMGKLMILKLRDDYKAKVGSAYTLQGFHDAFLKEGPLPLPLMRRAMLGATGQLF